MKLKYDINVSRALLAVVSSVRIHVTTAMPEYNQMFELATETWQIAVDNYKAGLAPAGCEDEAEYCKFFVRAALLEQVRCYMDAHEGQLKDSPSHIATQMGMSTKWLRETEEAIMNMCPQHQNVFNFDTAPGIVKVWQCISVLPVLEREMLIRVSLNDTDESIAATAMNVSKRIAKAALLKATAYIEANDSLKISYQQGKMNFAG